MSNETFSLGAVSARYDDYLGTAAADDVDAMAVSRSLYQLVGLDRERWMILSLEMTQSRQGERISVYAIDRLEHQVATMEDVDQLAQSAGSVPVVAFDLPASVQLRDFVTSAFQRLSVRLVSRAVQGRSMNVVDHQRLSEAVV